MPELENGRLGVLILTFSCIEDLADAAILGVLKAKRQEGMLVIFTYKLARVLERPHMIDPGRGWQEAIIWRGQMQPATCNAN